MNVLIPVSSSNIKATSFDPDRRVMTVVFHSGGMYEYSGVSQESFDAFLAAPSKGRFLNEFIKPKFDVKKIVNESKV